VIATACWSAASSAFVGQGVSPASETAE